MTKPLVVLGAGGKLGKLLAPFWPQHVVTHDRHSMDIKDRPRLTRALQGAGAVLCFAGATHDTTRPMALNTTLAHAALNAAQDAKAGRVFLMSSAAIYGNQNGLLAETTPPLPLTAYAASKVEMEQMAALHTHPSTCLRLGNVAGADAILGGWRPGFALDTLPDGCTPKRSYIGPATLARVLTTLAAANTLPEILNVAAPGPIEMGALLDAAQRSWTPRPTGPEVIPEINLSVTSLLQHVDISETEATPVAMVAQWKSATV